MIRRFIVISPGSTARQQNTISQYVCDPQRFSFWHHSSEVWLLSTVGTLPENAAQLRNTLMTVAPGAQLVVIEVEKSTNPPSWAYSGDSSWGDWLAEAWDGSQPSEGHLRGA